MTDPIRRAIRTLLQFIAGGGLGTFVTEVVADITDARLQALVLAASVMLVSWAQNELEDRGAIPGVLKAPPSAGANPVPDPQAGHYDIVAVALFLLVLLVVLRVLGLI